MNIIKKNGYKIWDMTSGELPEIPEVKFIGSFDEFFDSLEYRTNTMYDFLWIYNTTGFLVEKVIRYKDPDESVGIGVSYNMFGTFVKENDTDRYFPRAETGICNLGNFNTWEEYQHAIIWMEEVRPLNQLKEDITAFYDNSELGIPGVNDDDDDDDDF